MRAAISATPATEPMAAPTMPPVEMALERAGAGVALELEELELECELDVAWLVVCDPEDDPSDVAEGSTVLVMTESDFPLFSDVTVDTTVIAEADEVVDGADDDDADDDDDDDVDEEDDDVDDEEDDVEVDDDDVEVRLLRVLLDDAVFPSTAALTYIWK